MLKYLIVCAVLCPLFLSAQHFPTYLSVEGGGNGILGSVNFGKPVVVHPNYKIIFQWGIGWNSDNTQSKIPINFPIQIVSHFGKEKYFFEAGLGTTMIFDSTIDNPLHKKATNEIYLSPVLGFRQETRKWFWRVYTCPLIHLSGEKVSDDLTAGFVKLGIGLGIIL